MVLTLQERLESNNRHTCSVIKTTTTVFISSWWTHKGSRIQLRQYSFSLPSSSPPPVENGKMINVWRMRGSDFLRLLRRQRSACHLGRWHMNWMHNLKFFNYWDLVTHWVVGWIPSKTHSNQGCHTLVHTYREWRQEGQRPAPVTPAEVYSDLTWILYVGQHFPIYKNKNSFNNTYK